MAIGIGEAAAVVTTLKNATDLLTKLRSTESKDDIQSGVAAITEMLVSARLAALNLVEQKAVLIDERSQLAAKIKELEAEIGRLSDFDLTAGKYERIRVQSGIFVYREKGIEGGPLFCPHCFAEKSVRILQQNSDGSYAQCHSCKFGEYLRHQDQVTVVSRPNDDYWNY